MHETDLAPSARPRVARLDAFFPIEAARLQALMPEQPDDIDAFLKRLEQLVLTLQDQVFIGIALREGEEPREMSRRDVAELMERLGAVRSAKQFRHFVAVRNRLAHLYPEDPAGQAANLNAAYEAAPEFLRAGRGSCRICRASELSRTLEGSRCPPCSPFDRGSGAGGPAPSARPGARGVSRRASF